MVRSSFCRCGWSATAAIIGTMCRNKNHISDKRVGRFVPEIDFDVGPHALATSTTSPVPSPSGTRRAEISERESNVGQESHGRTEQNSVLKNVSESL